MKKRIISFLLALTLLCAAPAYAGAGDADDPLVTQSYADTTGASLLSSVLSALKTAMNTIYEKAADLLRRGDLLPDSVTATTYIVHTGGQALLSQGGCFTLISGTASINIRNGAVVNVTVGYPAATGRLIQYNRYLGCENADAVISLSDGAVIAVEGNVDVSVGCPFQDVPLDSWFFQDVLSAYNRGLINGMSETIYDPNGSLTVAQAIKLAACMHQLNRDGAVTLASGSSGQWYDVYLTYALEQDILDESYSGLDKAAMDTPITRAEFVHVFYNALPRSSYNMINAVVLNAIPDVSEDDLYSDEIYTFYRAGILTGDTADEDTPAGMFRPGDPIKRSEVATIMNRMFDNTARKHFTLT